MRSSDGLVLRVAGPLRANDHWTDYASVTTTENFVLCAALAAGTSTLMNAASEPHVQEFCQFMRMLGAKIEGLGTSRLTIHGVAELGGGDFTFAEDFHEIVTFLALGAITGGQVEVKNSTPEQFPLTGARVGPGDGGMSGRGFQSVFMVGQRRHWSPTRLR